MRSTHSQKSIAAITLLLALAGSVTSILAQDIQVVHYTNTVWFYNDTSISTDNPTIAPGTSWRESAYVPVVGSGPTQWKANGRGLFGNDTSTVYTNAFGAFGNGFRTPCDRLIDGTAARVTFYFITKFNWAFPPGGVILRGTNYLDDGAVVYLNGVEVFRSRLGTAGTIPAWSDLAANQGSEGVPEPLEYSATSLVTGENTLAVEVHQSGTTSSDLAFATALRAVIPFAPAITGQPADRAVLQNRPTTLTVIGDGSPRPTYQWYKDEVAISGATSNSYSIALMQSTDAGGYKAILANEFGSATSRVAQVSYQPDEVSPLAIGAVGSATFTEITVQFNEAIDLLDAEEEFNYTILDSNMNGYQVDSAIRSADGTSVTLSHALVGPHPSGTVLTLSITLIKDLAGKLMADTNITLRSWVTNQCPGMIMEIYSNTGGGNNVADLVNHPDYPNNPQQTFTLTEFNSRQFLPTDGLEGYGGRIRGFFIPNLSGNWRFFLRSDDASQLWLNPNGIAASGRTLIAFENGCCNNYLDYGASQTSAGIPLQAGTAYYIDALWKEGTGGDFCQVAARPEGAGVPPTTESMSGGAIGIPAVPFGTANCTLPALTISQSGNTITISWTGVPAILQKATEVAGPYTDVDLSAAPSPRMFDAPAVPTFYRTKGP